MEQNNANEIVNEYITRIYSFVKKRVSNEADAQDIAQEIALKLYKSLCIKEVVNVEGFVWTVARNTLSNFYRDKMCIRDSFGKTSEQNITMLPLSRYSTIPAQLTFPELIGSLWAP